MRGFNKELIINGEVYRSPEQQVYENMKNIKELQEKIKDAYKTSEALTSSSVSVAIADTNAPEGTTEGWIMTSDGLLFSITGGDDTNLLLEYYADLKGPQGESGAAVNIDDSTTSATKVWSSQKTNNSLDKGIFTTMVEPTDLGGGAEYRLDYEDAPILTSGIHVKENDLILYIDGDSKVKYLYSVSAVYEEYVYLFKQGEIGGSTTYLHLINITRTDNSTGFTLTIESTSNTPFTISSLLSWLTDKGIVVDLNEANYNQKVYPVSGGYSSGGVVTGAIYGINNRSDTINVYAIKTGGIDATTIVGTNLRIVDTVIPK